MFLKRKKIFFICYHIYDPLYAGHLNSPKPELSVRIFYFFLEIDHSDSLLQWIKSHFIHHNNFLNKKQTEKVIYGTASVLEPRGISPDICIIIFMFLFLHNFLALKKITAKTRKNIDIFIETLKIMTPPPILIGEYVNLKKNGVGSIETLTSIH